MALLRGSADRQRQARGAPRRGAGLQGPLPALPHDEGLPRAAARRLGLPRDPRRARGRAPARLHAQAGHRGLRGRGVQRAVPPVGADLCAGLEPPDRAHRVLGGPRRGVLDDERRVRRERLVVAVVAVGRRPALRGSPRRPVLPALRHAAVGPRGGAGLRAGHRPVGVRAVPGAGGAAGGGGPAGVDDHAVDADLQRRGGRGTVGALRAGPGAQLPWAPTRAPGGGRRRAGDGGARRGRGGAARRVRRGAARACTTAGRSTSWGWGTGAPRPGSWPPTGAT